MASSSTGIRAHLRERIADDGTVLEVRPAKAWFGVCLLLGVWAFQSAGVRYTDVGPVGIVGNLCFGTYLLALGLSFRRPWVRADADGISSGLLVRRHVAWADVEAISLAELLMMWRPSSVLVRRRDGEVVRIRAHSLRVLRHQKASELVRIARALVAMPDRFGLPVVDFDPAGYVDPFGDPIEAGPPGAP